MDWIPLLGAVGAGAIATKLLDVLWLQRMLQNNERRTWLREQRAKAYVSLTRELLTQGLWHGQTTTQEVLTLVADCTLLSTSKDLLRLLSEYVPEVIAARNRLDRFINNGTSSDESRGAMLEREEVAIKNRSLQLVTQLRVALVIE